MCYTRVIMSEVLLLHAEDVHTRGFVGAMPPLGLAWLASTLEGAGISVEILDRQVEEREFDDVFRAGRPSVLGISTTTATRFEAFNYAARAKELHPDQGGDTEKFKELRAAYETIKKELNKED